jgi:hypothetical protein
MGMSTTETLNTAGNGGQETTAAKAFGAAIHEVATLMWAVTMNTALLKDKGLPFHKEAVGETLVGLCLCRMIDICLKYVSDALRLVYSKYPGGIAELNDKIDVRLVFQVGSMEELRAELLERKVTKLSYSSLKALDKYLLKNLTVSLFPDEESKNIACLLVDVRNLIVHNAGIVNRKFKEEHPESPAPLGSRVSLGAFENEGNASFLIDWIMDLDVRLIQKFDLSTEPRVAVSLPKPIKMGAA